MTKLPAPGQPNRIQPDPARWIEARSRYGVEVTVLRVLAGQPPARSSIGGPVTYLVEADHLRPPYAGPVRVDLSAHPLRHAYAEPGGPAESLRWALAALGDRSVAVTQLRTWNLSAIWRLDTPAGPAWLKQVPAFFAHEAAVLRWVAERGSTGLVPPLTTCSRSAYPMRGARRCSSA